MPIQCSTSSSGSSLASPALVSRPPGSVSRPSQAFASDGDLSKTTLVGQVPSGPWQTPATRLEAVRRSLGEAVFSRDTAENERMATPQLCPPSPSMTENGAYSVLSVVEGSRSFLCLYSLDPGVSDPSLLG